MTIKEAFEEYAKEPQYKRLAGTYRQSFTNVFLKKHANVDIKDVDLKLTKAIVKESDQPQIDTIRACAALVLALQHASTKGHCTNPGFHTDDVFRSEETDNSETPEVKVKREALERRAKELIAKAKAGDKEAKKKAAKITKKVRKISKPKAVVQLDPKTYEPIKTYSSAGAAGRAVGSSNILRAVKEHTQSAGFFWAFENEVKDFTPSKLSLTHRAERFKLRKLTPIPAGVTNEDIEAAIEEIDAASEQLREQQEELEAERQEKRHILAEYTDDELLGEMRRREWRGNVIIPVNYEL